LSQQQEITRVPTDLHEFYRTLPPLRKHDGTVVGEFAPYQVSVWNDRFAGYRLRHYVRGPGVGLTGILLMESLNMALASKGAIDILVLVADQFAAQKRRDEMVKMIEGSAYSACLVRNGEASQKMRTYALSSRAGVALRAPHDRSDAQVRGISFESIVCFDARSMSMDHVLVLDAMESDFPAERIAAGLSSARTPLLSTGGTMVVAMIPRASYYGLGKRMPKINDLEPGELHVSDGEAVRRIPMSVAIDAGIIGRSDACRVEMRLLDKPIRDAKIPDMA